MLIVLLAQKEEEANKASAALTSAQVAKEQAIYIDMCVCAYVYVYVYTYIHTRVAKVLAIYIYMRVCV